MMSAEPAKVNMLLTGGCSYVWGDELDGCWKNPAEHHKYTFAKILSDHLEIPFRNTAVPGNGNQKIFRDITNYLNSPKGDKVTHMVIIWTYWGREEFAEALTKEEDDRFRCARYQNMSEISESRVWSLKEPLRSKVKSLYEEEGWRKSHIISSLSYMVAMKLIAEARGIKLIQGVFHSICWNQIVEILSDTNENYSDYRNYLKTTLRSLPHHHRIGLTGVGEDFHSFAKKRNLPPKEQGHPSEKSHELYAGYLHSLFKSVNWD